MITNFKKPRITVEQDRLDIRGVSDLELALRMLFSAQLQLMNNTLATVPESERNLARGELFDQYNIMASSLLDIFDPDAKLHPGLTAKAIMEMENEYIEREAARLAEAAGTGGIGSDTAASEGEENCITIDVVDLLTPTYPTGFDTVGEIEGQTVLNLSEM